MFFETLYRVNPIGKTFNSDDPVSILETEYYQPLFDFEFRNGEEVFFVREKHGYFDDQQKKLVNPVTTLDPEEGFTRADEAWKRYEQQLRYRASQGFTQAFFVGGPEHRIAHRILDVNAVSLLPD